MTTLPVRSRVVDTTRDPALDALRGWCIVSMATAHLALGSTWWSVMHWAGWIDGAVGFVLLSGLVVGMTQRRAVTRGGLPVAYRKTSRRAFLLFAIHCELCLLALTISAAVPAQSGRLPSAAAEGGWAAAVVKVVTLRINPPTASILGLYVVMTLIGMVAVYFLARGRPLLALGCSALIYASAWVFPGATTFPERAFVPGYVNWATWQGLFVVAMVLGWYWQDARVGRILSSRNWLGAAFAVSVGLAVLGHADVRRGAFTESGVEDQVRWVFANGKLGPGTIVFAFAAALALYRGFQWAERLAPVGTLLVPLRMLGRRSLDSYIIIAVASLCLPAIFSYRPDAAAGALLALGALVLCLGWSVLRQYGNRKEASFFPSGQAQPAHGAPRQP